MVIGLISVSSSCRHIHPLDAFIIGIVGCILSMNAKAITKGFLDDPLSLSFNHGVCGLWGLLASGIFDIQQGLLATGSLE